MAGTQPTRQSRRSSGGGGDRRVRGGGKARSAPPGDRVAELAGPLGKVLDRLPETQRRVLEYRMGLVDGHPHSLADTAAALGLGQVEAREIEARALDHIREVVPLDRLGRLLGN
jgi:DNA-directed RNA polymerase specialized sigma24 family protein